MIEVDHPNVDRDMDPAGDERWVSFSVGIFYDPILQTERVDQFVKRCPPSS